MVKIILYNGKETRYQVDENGNVYSSIRNKNLKPMINRYGYPYVNLYIKPGLMKSICIHRLVASAFIPNPNNYPSVNHIDGNKANNNFRNLEWCTIEYNNLHAIKNGLNAPHQMTDATKLRVMNTRESKIRTTKLADRCNPAYHYKYKLLTDEVETIIGLLTEGKTCGEIADLLHISIELVYNIKNRKSFKYLTDGIEFPQVSSVTSYRGEKVNTSVLTNSGADIAIELLYYGLPASIVSHIMHVSKGIIKDIRDNSTWTHLPRPSDFELCIHRNDQYKLRKYHREMRETVDKLEAKGLTELEIGRHIKDTYNL